MLKWAYARHHLHVCVWEGKGEEEARSVGNNAELEFSQDTWAKESTLKKKGDNLKCLLL